VKEFLVINYKDLPAKVLAAFGHKMQAKIMYESTKLAPTLPQIFLVSQHLQVPTEMPNPSNVSRSRGHTEWIEIVQYSSQQGFSGP
jgi:hypothetical protein